MIQLVKHFFQKLNLDDEKGFLKPAEYLSSLNNHVGTSVVGNGLVVEGVLGTTASSVTLPTGTNLTIGAVYDKVQDVIYYLIYNSNDDHSIWKWDRPTNVHTKIVESDVLNFQQDKLITGIALVDSKFLFWTDGVNPPRMLDITQTYSSITEQQIDQIPYPPLAPPDVEFGEDVGYFKNNLKKINPQFRYRYIYNDGRKSVFSPISPIPKRAYPTLGLDGKDLLNLLTKENYIDVDVYTGINVRRIEIAVRDNTNLDFYIVGSIESPTPETTATFRYYNDTVKIPIPENDLRVQDFVPLLAGSLEFNDGRIFEGDITEGYDNITMNVLGGIYYHGGSIIPPTTNFTATYGATELQFNTPGATYPAGSYLFLVKGIYVQVDLTGTTSKADFCTAINSAINGDTLLNPNGSGTSVLSQNRVVSSTLQGVSITTPDGSGFPAIGGIAVGSFIGGEALMQDYSGEFGVLEDINNTLSLKSNANHQWGIAYSDEQGRMSAIQSDPNWDMFSLPHGQRTVDPVTGRLRYLANAELTLIHQPPIWATKYHIGYTRNKNIGRILGVIAAGGANESSGLMSFNLLSLQYMSLTNDRSRLAYNYEEGDRIRFIKPTLNDLPVSTFLTGNLDYEIVKYDPTTSKVFINKVGNLDQQRYFVEIYNPKNEAQENIFYEVGSHDIVNAGESDRYHGVDENGLGLLANGTNRLDGYIADEIGGGTRWVIKLDKPIRGVTFQVSFNTVVIRDSADAVELGTGTLESWDVDERTITVIINTGTYPGDFTGAISRLTFSNQPTLYMKNIGDVWVRNRALPVVADVSLYRAFIAEDYAFSDFYESASISIGRPNLIDKEVKQLRRPNIIRFSNKYIPETNVNGLGSYEAVNEEFIPYECGAIRKLINNADVERNNSSILLAICENETASLFIGQTIIRQVGGEVIEAQSDKVIGAVNILRGNWGTINPESVVAYNSMVYWWDGNKGRPCKYDINGIDDIASGYENAVKMVSYFQEKSDIYRSTKKTAKIIGGFDPKHNEFILTFPATDTGFDEETVVYSQTDRVWKGFMSFIPELYLYSQQDLISFKRVGSNGPLWIHDNANIARFYGTNYPRKLKFVCNIGQALQKVFTNIVLEADEAWQITFLTQEGQVSSLEVTDFEEFDKVWVSQILRDANTPTEALRDGELPLIDGDVLESRYLIVELTKASNTQSIIRAVDIGVLVGKGLRIEP